MTGPALRLAAGGDRLSAARAEAVAGELRAAHPALDVRVVLVPAPDRSAVALAVRRAVLDGEADVGVHAFGDLPLAPAEGLVVGAVPMRADARDVLIARDGKALQFQPPGTRIGTDSARCAAQLLRRRSDLAIAPIRGDALERLAALDRGEVDALVLPAADLQPLDLLDRATQYFDSDLMIPAPGQGALALEARDGDRATIDRLAPLHDEATAYAVRAERVCLERLGGDSSRPIGIFALTDGELMAVHGIVSRPDGSRSARLRWSGPWRAADDVGETLAELLLAAGAGNHLGHRPPPGGAFGGNGVARDTV